MKNLLYLFILTNSFASCNFNEVKIKSPEGSNDSLAINDSVKKKRLVLTDSSLLLIVEKHFIENRVTKRNGLYLLKINQNDTEATFLTKHSGILPRFLKGNNIIFYDSEQKSYLIYNILNDSFNSIPDSLSWLVYSNDKNHLYFLNIFDNAKCKAKINSFSLIDYSVKEVAWIDLASMKIYKNKKLPKFVFDLPTPIVCNSEDGMLVNQAKSWHNYLFFFSSSRLDTVLDFGTGGIGNNMTWADSVSFKFICSYKTGDYYLEYDCILNKVINFNSIDKKNIINFYIVKDKIYGLGTDNILYEFKNNDKRKVLSFESTKYDLIDVLKL